MVVQIWKLSRRSGCGPPTNETRASDVLVLTVAAAKVAMVMAAACLLLSAARVLE